MAGAKKSPSIEQVKTALQQLVIKDRSILNKPLVSSPLLLFTEKHGELVSPVPIPPVFQRGSFPMRFSSSNDQDDLKKMLRGRNPTWQIKTYKIEEAIEALKEQGTRLPASRPQLVAATTSVRKGHKQQTSNGKEPLRRKTLGVSPKKINGDDAIPVNPLKRRADGPPSSLPPGLPVKRQKETPPVPLRKPSFDELVLTLWKLKGQLYNDGSNKSTDRLRDDSKKVSERVKKMHPDWDVPLTRIQGLIQSILNQTEDVKRVVGVQNANNAGDDDMMKGVTVQIAERLTSDQAALLGPCLRSIIQRHPIHLPIERHDASSITLDVVNGDAVINALVPAVRECLKDPGALGSLLYSIRSYIHVEQNNTLSFPIELMLKVWETIFRENYVPAFSSNIERQCVETVVASVKRELERLLRGDDQRFLEAVLGSPIDVLKYGRAKIFRRLIGMGKSILERNRLTDDSVTAQKLLGVVTSILHIWPPQAQLEMQSMISDLEVFSNPNERAAHLYLANLNLPGSQVVAPPPDIIVSPPPSTRREDPPSPVPPPFDEGVESPRSPKPPSEASSSEDEASPPPPRAPPIATNETKPLAPPPPMSQQAGLSNVSTSEADAASCDGSMSGGRKVKFKLPDDHRINNNRTTYKDSHAFQQGGNWFCKNCNVESSVICARCCKCRACALRIFCKGDEPRKDYRTALVERLDVAIWEGYKGKASSFDLMYGLLENTTQNQLDVNYQRMVVVDEKRVRGETALMAAARQGRRDLVLFLLHRGADPNMTTYSGETAYDLACRYNHRQVAISLWQRMEGSRRRYEA